jgi:lysophospholipase L1-like esterase
MYPAPARTLRPRALCALICLLLSLTCAAHSSGNAPSAASKYLVIVGASYAEEWHTPQLPGYIVINRALCGQVTSEVRERFERDVIELKPDAVLIWGHNNDVIRSSPENMEATKRIAQENLQAMTEAARAAGITPILVTEPTLPISTTITEKLRAFVGHLRGKIDYRAQKNIHIKALNSWLRAYAKAQNIQLLDFETALQSENGSRKEEYAKADHSHITAEGYAAINKYVASQPI